MSDFNAIADDLCTQGWSLRPQFLTARQVAALRDELRTGESLRPAGIGRETGLQRDAAIRSDSIRWLDVLAPAERDYLALMERLRLYLNQRLMFGLFDYEAHFARYAPGEFYRRHLDTFRMGAADTKPVRVLTTVAYLNEDWRAEDGGELVVWGRGGGEVLRTAPRAGTAIFFMSEEFSHEVLPAQRERLSIAGWFRRRGS
jgi:SM-20-related protein